MKSRLRSALLSVLVLVVAVIASAETLGYVYLRHVVELNWKPAWMGWSGKHRRVGTWHKPHETWGFWREANASAQHENACFSVPLRSNGVGARDRERSRDGAHRTILIGDSFAEGWGVLDDQRVSNLLEARLGREFLNFGTSGQGPLQYQLVYGELAAEFAHDQVLVLLFPGNDFTDNDYAHWRKRSGETAPARPYYARQEDGSYRAIYPVKRAELERKRAAPRGFWYDVWTVIRTNSWAIRTIEYVAAQVKLGRGYAGYFDVTDTQLDAVVWSLGEIRRRAGDRKVIVALVPEMNDFNRAKTDGPGNLPGRLEPRLRALDIAMVDLMPALASAAATASKDISAFYLRCDGHWTVVGNEAAANALLASGRFSGSSSPPVRP